MKQGRRFIGALLAVCMMAAMAGGCGAKNGETAAEAATTIGGAVAGTTAAAAAVTEGAATAAESAAVTGGAAAKTAAAAAGPDSVGSESGRLDAEVFSYAEGEAAAADGGPGETAACLPTARQEIQPQSGTLTAGEWNDNTNYDYFKDVLNHNDWYSYMEIWKLFPTSRYAVQVTNENQEAAKNQKVELMAGQRVIGSAVTDSEGMAYVYYNLDHEEKKADIIRIGDTEYALEEKDKDGTVHLVLKSYEEPEEKTLDLLFMVDTTGSMSDELEFLKLELQDVIRRVAEEYEGIRIRLSVNFYRDREDAYVVRDFPFTEDIDEALSRLRVQYSDGGGDYPEAVDEAFENAVKGHEWSEDSVKLLFFVLDAPPHSDRNGTVDLMGSTLSAAAESGIRVLPVASSGVDTETEYLLRTMAAVSGGTYIFLTDDSGVGDSHLEPTIGDYDVEYLNDLMVRLINWYCK
ncbi:vWA domain-containing protein [Lachnospiraceae bacterium 45-P1]